VTVFTFVYFNPSQVSEIKNIGFVPADKHIGMVALCSVVLASSSFAKDIVRLTCPVFQVGGKINAQSFSVIDNRKILVFPEKHHSTFTPTVVYHFAAVSPVNEVFAFRVIDGFPVLFVVIVHTPLSGRSFYHTGVNDMIRCQFAFVCKSPVDKVIAH
jgi:hypothetical protein